MTINFATAWEAVADQSPDEDALICGDVRRSWREFEDRSARVAGALRSNGVGVGDNVGLCLYNGNEYLEAEFGAMKERCSPFNINYRYTAQELADLLDGADAKAVFFSAALEDRFADIHAELGDVALFVEVGATTEVPGWAIDFEALVAGNEPATRIERSPEDLWILFTGGTTGKPKGVMWPFSSLAGTMAPTFEAMGLSVPQTEADVPAIAQTIREQGRTTRQLAAAPLMHGTAGMSALSTLLQGGAVLTLPSESFDAAELWDCVQRERATHLTIVGDAFCRPMIEALDEAAAAGQPYDLSSIFLIVSSGVMWSAPVKEALLERNPQMRLMDALGSSEGVGFARKLDGDGSKVKTARFELGPFTKVLTEDGREVQPGSDERGRLALGGPLPLGYYNDPEKSAETFPVVNGVRYSIPGDWATVEADGTITLLGRGSACINTGGEKVYPEEVEEALKLLVDVVDVNVVGVPDERWGQAITAVVELTASSTIDDDALTAGVREHLAGYKTPKHIIRVPRLLRGPNGKPDYKWATQTAREALGIDSEDISG